MDTSRMKLMCEACCGFCQSHCAFVIRLKSEAILNVLNDDVDMRFAIF